jgi:hypothetical protein
MERGKDNSETENVETAQVSSARWMAQALIVKYFTSWLDAARRSTRFPLVIAVTQPFPGIPIP